MVIDTHTKLKHKMKYTISILVSIVIVTSCWSQNTLDANNINGKKFYYEGLDKSIIHFKGDSIFIADFTLLSIGPLYVSCGTFKIDTQTKEIKCTIQKIVKFSMNIGEVSRYSKGCNQRLDFQLSENGKISKKRYTLQLGKNGTWEWTEVGLITYSEQMPKNLHIDCCLSMNLYAYENDDKLVECEEFKGLYDH